ncbi:VOC family protein [Paenibacillus camelliae]|uniref:VOC family protein n=1 Tax=Paenibacillus camelliae TaxID=512410 RepID=UPI002040B8CE|nr:VOC family protein [Paenibacillus camelliae]MCM3634932.1 VOC family protein [Paenibacillus camelliae]
METATKVEFDGGFIMVPAESFDEGVEWYRKHMDWELIDSVLSPVGRKAFFRLPGGGQVNLKSFELEHEHFTPNGYEEGHMRFCFVTANLENAMAYYSEQGITFSDPFVMPDGTRGMDINAFGNVRLTLCEDKRLQDEFPNAKFIRYADKPLWLGVRSLKSAVAWYESVLGLRVFATDYSDQGFALLGEELEGEGKWEYIWLEELPDSTPYTKANPGARMYFVVWERDQFLELEQRLREQGIETSTPVGERWMGFHFYDPDGNRINVWNYY